MPDISTMHCEAPEPEDRICAYCQRPFIPARRWSAFCSSDCRTGYDVDNGMSGRVARIQKINRGARETVSIVIHLDGQAAERALNLGLQEHVRIVRKP